jgi:excisionase family DNA binding protein
MGERWIRSKEAAELLDVDERTVRRMCTRGELEAELIPSGSQWRIQLDERGRPARRSSPKRQRTH